MSTPEQRLTQLGITLPPAAAPVANYVPVVQTGSLLFVSGQLPLVDGKLLIEGKLGAGVSNQAGEACARACFINILAQLQNALEGDLSRVKQVVRLGGFVACAPDFTELAPVMNGASDLAATVFAPHGNHARSTVGVTSLPLNAPVEVEAIFEVV
ncbi:RidA family protein [Oecophyllibacter saccharovorans]|uniref:RidA family protein n=1 Tax=Oecophyllibacter saccharovorans TaxID=2558360 RepID=A0A506UKR9_9PROT|nr:RidA family protein [Oecophyllibacter saccharovorans]QDH15102.1 RidA family protein [Oecophyllibacter saccharovorans]TPW33939.1 RidA family protein [Oecophyllibacter saccharovorans]TPW35280.1 RidA family protein [Oecophyllibacter saccharovorans]